jgi:ribosomal protein L22
MVTARRLTTRQLRSLSYDNARIMLEQSKNMEFAKLLIEESDRVELANEAIKHLIQLGASGDTRANRMMVKLAKSNNEQAQNWGLLGVNNMAARGHAEVLPTLIFAAEKGSRENLTRAIRGIIFLAQLGNQKAQKYLQEKGIKW